MSAEEAARAAIGNTFKSIGGTMISFGTTAGVMGALKTALDKLTFAGSAAGFLTASAVGIGGGILLKQIGNKILSGGAASASAGVSSIMGGGGGVPSGGGGGGGSPSPPTSIPGLSPTSFSGLGGGLPNQGGMDGGMSAEFRIKGDDMVAFLKRNNRHSELRTGKTILQE